MTETSAYSILSGRSAAGGGYSGPTALPGGNALPDAGNTPPLRSTGKRLLELNSLVEALNSKSRSIGRAIRFQVNLDSPTAIVQVIDRDTGRLIRQIPHDQAAVMARNAQSLNLERIIDVV